MAKKNNSVIIRVITEFFFMSECLIDMGRCGDGIEKKYILYKDKLISQLKWLNQSVCVWALRLSCTIHPSGDLSVWPAGGHGAGGRADGGKWQYDLCGLQTSVWPDQWEHWRCLPATSRRRQQGEAHAHTHTHTREPCWFLFFFFF